MNNSIENQICEAIETIVDNAVANAGFDRTIQAIIISTEDTTTGKYKCKYQDSTFYAYSTGATAIYKKGANVYVLIPKNDMRQTKTILGTVDKLGTDYAASEYQNQYNYIGANVINTPAGGVGLSSRKVEDGRQIHTITLYETDEQGAVIQQQEGFNVDILAANEYIKQSNGLMCGAMIQTQLPDSQVAAAKGDYGIIFTLVFQDNDETEHVTRSYSLSSKNIIGNPYKLFALTRQTIIFPQIQGDSFLWISKIFIYAKDFSMEKENESENPNIFFSSIELQGVTAFTEAEINGYALGLETPNGSIMDMSSKTVKAQLYSKGIEIDIPKDAIIQWFIEDGRITAASEGYTHYGGIGWRRLDLSGVEVSILKEWTAAYNNNIKCVVAFADSQVSKTVMLINREAAAAISLTFDKNTQFYQNKGQGYLTCKVDSTLDNDENIVYNYYWKVIDKAGNETALDETSNKLLVRAIDIDEQNTYKCFVYQDEYQLGYNYLTIYNSQVIDVDYTLEIVNGNQVFMYDEEGKSPTHFTKTTKQEILPLTFKVWDKQGNDVTQNALDEGEEAVWDFPVENTLLLDCKVSGNKHETVTFDIQQIYNYDNKNNIITLTLPYHGLKLVATTDFVFVKSGESGTNGTAFVAQIVPNVQVTANEQGVVEQFLDPPVAIYVDGSPWVSANGADKWFNFKWNAQEQPFKMRLFNGVTAIKEEEYENTIKWEILKNKYDESHFVINSNEISLAENFEFGAGAKVCDILKGSLTYEGKTYYSLFPIAVVNLINIGELDAREVVKSLELQAGFDKVLYESDGAAPQYDTVKPFKVAAGLTEYSWSLSESGQLSPKIINMLDKGYENEAAAWGTSWPRNTNTFMVTPIEIYDNYALDSAVMCNIKDVADIRFPVLLYLDKYGLVNINEWVGNSVDIGDDKILAAQVGAGVKNEEDNTFTGVVIGEVKSLGPLGIIESEKGLFGYSHGEQSIFLDADTGNAVFGSKKNGQVKISVEQDKEGNAESIISGGNYEAPVIEWGSNGKYNVVEGHQGLEINLSKPSITYGSGNLYINPEGVVYAEGAQISGNLTTTNGNVEQLSLTGALITNGGAMWVYGSRPSAATTEHDWKDGVIAPAEGTVHDYISFGQNYNPGNLTKEDVLRETDNLVGSYKDPGLDRIDENQPMDSAGQTGPDGRIYFGVGRLIGEYDTGDVVIKDVINGTDTPFHLRDAPHAWIDGTLNEKKDMLIHTNSVLNLEGNKGVQINNGAIVKGETEYKGFKQGLAVEKETLMEDTAIVSSGGMYVMGNLKYPLADMTSNTMLDVTKNNVEVDLGLFVEKGIYVKSGGALINGDIAVNGSISAISTGTNGAITTTSISGNGISTNGAITTSSITIPNDDPDYRDTIIGPYGITCENIYANNLPSNAISAEGYTTSAEGAGISDDVKGGAYLVFSHGLLVDAYNVRNERLPKKYDGLGWPRSMG